LIDTATLKEFTLTLGELKKLGEQEGRCRNPKTGTYTVATPMVCASCGQQIPMPEGSVGGQSG
jgi:hypothetical protein